MCMYISGGSTPERPGSEAVACIRKKDPVVKSSSSSLLRSFRATSYLDISTKVGCGVWWGVFIHTSKHPKGGWWRVSGGLVGLSQGVINP